MSQKAEAVICPAAWQSDLQGQGTSALPLWYLVEASSSLVMWRGNRYGRKRVWLAVAGERNTGLCQSRAVSAVRVLRLP